MKNSIRKDLSNSGENYLEAVLMIQEKKGVAYSVDLAHKLGVSKPSVSVAVQSGEMISVCMTSDFFLEEADAWRAEAWDMMRTRSDVIFLLLTKRPERVRNCLPKDWGAGWENIFLNVTCENQRRADERLPLLLELPFQHSL